MTTAAKPRTYLVHVASGCEKAVCSLMMERARALHVLDRIHAVKAPQMPKTTKRKDGVVTTRQVFVYPGYVFVELELDADVSRAVLSTPHVIGFVGNKPSMKAKHTHPTPLKEKELAKIFKQESTVVPTVNTDSFCVGQYVTLNSGPFAEYDAEIIDITPQKIRVLLEIFGRDTTVEVTPDQISFKDEP